MKYDIIETVWDRNFHDLDRVVGELNISNTIRRLVVSVDNGRLAIEINGVDVYKGNMVDGVLTLEAK